MSDALPTALEQLEDRFICTPDRTHNRITSPRLAASGPQNKAGKGSWQARFVTSGIKIGSADRVQGPSLKIGATRKLLDATRCRVDSRLVTVDGQGMLFEAFPVQ